MSWYSSTNTNASCSCQCRAISVGPCCFRSHNKLQSVLFQIAKIHHAQLAFGFGVFLREFPGQLHQRLHVRPHPAPVLFQRVIPVLEQTRRVSRKPASSRNFSSGFRCLVTVPCGRLALASMTSPKPAAASLAGAGPFQSSQRPEAACRQAVSRGHFLKAGTPLPPPPLHFRHQQRSPKLRRRIGEESQLGGVPAFRVRQRLRVAVQLEHQFANGLIPAAGLGFDQVLNRLGSGGCPRRNGFQKWRPECRGPASRLPLPPAPQAAGSSSS